MMTVMLLVLLLIKAVPRHNFFIVYLIVSNCPSYNPFKSPKFTNFYIFKNLKYLLNYKYFLIKTLNKIISEYKIKILKILFINILQLKLN